MRSLTRLARLPISNCESSGHWPIRKIANSGGLVGATPIRQMSRPLSRSFCVFGHAVPADEVRRFWVKAQDRTVFPGHEQEVLHHAHTLHHSRRLWARTPTSGSPCRVDEELTNVDVLFLRVRGHGARGRRGPPALGAPREPVGSCGNVRKPLSWRCAPPS